MKINVLIVSCLFILANNIGFSQEMPTSSYKALERVNFYRTEARVDSSKLDAKLNKAADNHADYVRQNCNFSTVHYEVSGNPGFTGTMTDQRATAAGFRAKGFLSEDIAFTDSPEGAVDTWINSFYHRIPVIWARHNNIGYGEREISCGNPYMNHVNVMDFDLTAENSKYVYYPAPGQNQIPTAWTTVEGPEPFPRLSYPRGFPITLTLPSQIGKKWKTVNWNLEKQTGGRLVTYIDEPARYTGGGDPYFFPHQNSLCIVSQEVLNDNTVYKVTITIDFTSDGTVDSTFMWYFGTGNSNPPIDPKFDVKEELSLYKPKFNPNPLISFSKINLNLPAVLEIFNLNGELIYTSSGSEIIWNGNDLNGNKVPNGIYLYAIHKKLEKLQGRIVVIH
jgi:hypothetical protein